MKIIGGYVFFYYGYCSNFSEVHFTWSAFGKTNDFFCSEQAFMYAKAMFFHDFETADKILKEDSNPMTCKKLGRAVKGYDDFLWSKVRFDFMKTVVLEKFNQNSALVKALCDKKYDGKKFVEASPTDTIWGIGLPLDTPDKILWDKENWKGTNLLGKTIDYVRMKLFDGIW